MRGKWKLQRERNNWLTCASRVFFSSYGEGKFTFIKGKVFNSSSSSSSSFSMQWIIWECMRSHNLIPVVVVVVVGRKTKEGKTYKYHIHTRMYSRLYLCLCVWVATRNFLFIFNFHYLHLISYVCTHNFLSYFKLNPVFDQPPYPHHHPHLLSWSFPHFKGSLIYF